MKAKGKKKIKAQKPTYLREIQIRYKKKRVRADSPVGKPITGSKQVFAPLISVVRLALRHCDVASEAGNQWLLHRSDAYVRDIQTRSLSH